MEEEGGGERVRRKPEEIEREGERVNRERTCKRKRGKRERTM